MTRTLLDLETEFQVQANPLVIEKEQGTLRVAASVNPDCEIRARRAIEDVLGANDHSAFHAAREVAIDTIRQANADRCAMHLVVTAP